MGESDSKGGISVLGASITNAIGEPTAWARILEPHNRGAAGLRGAAQALTPVVFSFRR
jgi:hypothetical protein